MKAEIAELASEGFTPQKISTMLGYSEKAIQQVLEHPDTIELMKEFRSRPKEERIDSQYERIEKLALNTIEKNLAYEEVPVALKVLEQMNKRKAIVNPAPTTPANMTILNINLPNRHVPAEAMTLNQQGEIVSVGNRSFAPLPTSSLQEKFLNMKTSEKIKAEAARVDAAIQEDIAHG